MSIMISAIGVSYLLQNLVLYITGGLNKVYPTIPWISQSVKVFGATTKMVTLVTPVLVVVLVGAPGAPHQPHQGGHGHARRVQGF